MNGLVLAELTSIVTASVGADGKLTMSGRIQVSKDGVKPPQ